MAAASIVTIRNLSKIYAQGEIQVTALDNISLDIAAAASRLHL
jgi:ABC-type dipeptide/oligopeptide/nickel transport system ATPase subunit